MEYFDVFHLHESPNLILVDHKKNVKLGNMKVCKSVIISAHKRHWRNCCSLANEFFVFNIAS